MFKDIDLSNYTNYELQRCQFLIDVLYPEIQFTLDTDENIMIHKNTNPQISEQISIDELIYFIHIDVPQTKEYIEFSKDPYNNNVAKYFYNLFNKVSFIRETIEHMKLYLKYSPEYIIEEETNKAIIKDSISLNL